LNIKHDLYLLDSLHPFFSVFSGAQPNSSANVARTVCPTVGTAIVILPNHAKIIMEVITAKIGTSIASIVLRRVKRELCTKPKPNQIKQTELSAHTKIMNNITYNKVK